MRTNRLLISLILLGVIICYGGCSGTDRFQWSDFEWFSWSSPEETFNKGALMLPIQVDGYADELFLQLDTGVWQSCLNGISLTQLPRESYRAIRQGSVSMQATIAGRAAEGWKFAVMQGYGGPLEESNIIGTLGLDAFKGKVLVLDLPNSRLAVVNSTRQLPDELAQAVHYVPAEAKHGRFIVKLSVGDEELRALYDTGSSIFTLVAYEPIWRDLTGRSGNEADNTILSIPSWGQTLEMVGAPAQAALKFADFTIPEPEVFYVRDGAFDPLFRNERLDVVMGNAPFYDDYVVVLDFKGSRFGVAPATVITE